MQTVGLAFPTEPRNTIVQEVEEWYQQFLSERLGRPCEPIKRSNFGQYSMAVNYLTSVLDEAKAIEKVAIFNIDHMAQIQFTGKDAASLLHRVLPTNIHSMKIGQCKYTLLLNQKGCVLDDMIIMRRGEEDFVLVINAGHDLTGTGIDHGVEKVVTSDADHILSYMKQDEDVTVKNLSEEYVKIDVQGPYSYKLLSSLYGKTVLRNRNNPEKNMAYFTFNEFDQEGQHFIISRTGYTNRWGWEVYIPVSVAKEHFKRIILKAVELGGLLVGLGGRDENRISAGSFGLPLMGQEYDPNHTPTNAPLFDAAVDMTKETFVGKEALLQDIEAGCDKKMAIVISEGLAVDKGIYLDGERLGTITSSIVSPNVPQEKREWIGSTRKNVNSENGTAAIGLGWFYKNPFSKDENGKDILEVEGKPVRIRVELYKEDENHNPIGKPLLGYISGNGVCVSTAPKALKEIESL